MIHKILCIVLCLYLVAITVIAILTALTGITVTYATAFYISAVLFIALALACEISDEIDS